MATIKGTRITILGADFSQNNIGNSNPLNDFLSRGNITSGGQVSAYTNLNNTLQTNGILPLLDRLFIFTENKVSSKLNFITPSGFVASVAAGYDSRFTKAGVVFNKDLLINIPFDQPAGVSNLSFGVYNATPEAGGNANNNNLCRTSGAAPNMFISRNLAGYYGYRIAGGINTYAGADAGVGLISADLNGTTSKLYKNGIMSQTKAETTANIGATTMALGDTTVNTTRAFFSAVSLTSDQHLALWNALNAFDTAWNAL